MPDMVVSTAFKAQDRVTKSFGRMSKGADKFGRSASKAFQKASRSGRGFQNITKGILAAGAVQRGLGLIEQGVGSVVRQFIEFDDAATGATVRFKDIGPAAENFAEQLKLVKDRAREAGAVTEFTAAQSAKALDFLARAGFSSAEAMGSLNSMINLSTATGEEFAQVADFSSDLLGAFGLAVNDTGQKIKNLNRLNDVLVKTANSANVTVEDMFETMKVGAPIATKFGASLEDVAAMTALMGNMGIKGSLGATAIKNIFTRLAKPTKEVTDSLGKLGITQDDLIDKNGKFKDISNTMELIGDRIKDLPQAKQLGVLSGIFGARALAGGANIVESISQIKEFTKVLNDANGTAEATADVLRKTLGNRLKALGSAATETGFKFLSAFDKDGKDAITRMTEAVRSFDVKPLVEGMKTAISVTKGLVSIIKPFIPILPVLIAGMVAYSTALKIQSFIAFISVIKGAAGAMGILNAVMAANPIGAVILGITALVAAGVLLVKNWDLVAAGMKKALGFIETAFIVTGKVLFRMFIDPLIFAFTGIAKTVLSLGSAIGKFAGIDTSGMQRIITDLEGVQREIEKNQASPILPPNRSEVEARQKVDLSGNIKVSGAPEGSTGKLKSSHGAVNMEFLGVNP